MTAITYIQGDAAAPKVEGANIIAHVCNDQGKWGKGFVTALSARWPEPEAAYRQWYEGRDDNDFGLGAVQFVQVEPDVWVANMVGQHGVRCSDQTPPIRYEALEQCLGKLSQKARELGASVPMPRIGCGLAGGKWEIVEPLVVKTLCAHAVAVTVYDLGAGKPPALPASGDPRAWPGRTRGRDRGSYPV